MTWRGRSRARWNHIYQDFVQVFQFGPWQRHLSFGTHQLTSDLWHPPTLVLHLFILTPFCRHVKSNILVVCILKSIPSGGTGRCNGLNCGHHSKEVIGRPSPSLGPCWREASVSSSHLHRKMYIAHRQMDIVRSCGPAIKPRPHPKDSWDWLQYKTDWWMVAVLLLFWVFPPTSLYDLVSMRNQDQEPLVCECHCTGQSGM